MKHNRDVAVICVAVLCVSGSDREGCAVWARCRGLSAGLSWTRLGSVWSQLSLTEPRLVLAWHRWSLGAEMARYNPPQVWVLIMSSADWSSITAERSQTSADNSRTLSPAQCRANTANYYHALVAGLDTQLSQLNLKHSPAPRAHVYSYLDDYHIWMEPINH